MKRKGICSVCGCTDEDGCDEGCGWANVKQTLCTACEPLSTAERLRKRDEALAELTMRYAMANAEANALAVRHGVLITEKKGSRA